LSLVDPDNRRPVDYGLRRQRLVALKGATPEEIWSRVDEGLPKLWVIRQALALRRRQPELFGPQGGYQPLPAQGARAEHVVAFTRGGGAITIVPRLVLGLQADWADTVIELPTGQWSNLLTGDEVRGGVVRLVELLARFPVGLLVRKAAAL
jgi:(1->4)-alpha-D-glucan 1-alpha-D-glucosylmutase